MIPLRDRRTVNRIRQLQQTLSCLTDDELRIQAQELRNLPMQDRKEKLFALTAIAINRSLGFEPFDEQLYGALAISEGYTAQMQTGQGKTVTAVFPAMLYACDGAAWISTANPYLASRDCEWMRPVYQRLGFTVGVTEAKMSHQEKMTAYRCDILYGANSEFGFDYLRDQLLLDADTQLQNQPFFMLVDEADSILLDEAVTPMILSSSGEAPDHNMLAADRFVSWLKSAEIQKLESGEDYSELDSKVDYVVLKREKTAVLTALGQKHAEQFFRIPDLTQDQRLYHLIFQALQAHGVLHRDVDYIVKDGSLHIVDPHTGRIMEGRRYCNGLWQALEVKERLDVVQESRTVASISYQQYYRRFPHLAGMTGTAWEGRQELLKVYHMPVRVIPPHQENRRVDLPDHYESNAEEQIRAMVRETLSATEHGQPCLLVTRTVEDSERLSAELTAYGITHEVLNARDDEREAEIIAKAGQAGKVTVSTAMAGRGTDIVLDDVARKAGGLYVMGFGHQNTRRGDRQLAGRSGRQGDPGKSRIFISSDDDLIRRYCPERPEGKKACVRAVKKAQENCESIAEAQRETTLKLDEVIGRFRDAVYAERNEILRGKLPQGFENDPPAAAKAVLLAGIDEAWSAFLADTESAKDRVELVSLAGKNYEIEYIRDIANMYHEMERGVLSTAHDRMETLREGKQNVGNV
ncbi:MAG: preprotein translocase subunit SecA [Oscillospiraceae bacterium]|nr:preprotein translocase subunit SecA [Oscillospiraceae bacterium]MBQ9664662.1 preprotein translocase subunit SecA [Oscillospiraceae bacterium]